MSNGSESTAVARTQNSGRWPATCLLHGGGPPLARPGARLYNRLRLLLAPPLGGWPTCAGEFPYLRVFLGGLRTRLSRFD